MNPGEQVFVPYGWDNLEFQILGAALSSHYWRVLSSREEICQVGDIGLVLIHCTGPMERVIDDVHRAHVEHASARIVVVGGEINDTELLQFIEAGAGAYVGGHQSFEDLINAMAMVREGRSPFSGRTTKQVLENINQLTRQNTSHAQLRLSRREQEILCFIAKGLSNKEIAGVLSISRNTVKNHVHNLLEKLNVTSRREAARAESRVRSHAGRSL